MDFTQQLELRLALTEAAHVLRDRNLIQGCRWAAEAVSGMQKLTDEQRFSLIQANNRQGTQSCLPKNTPEQEAADLSEAEQLMLANSYFATKEFDRCAHSLKGCKTPKAVFLRLYAMYLGGERRKEFDSDGVLGQNDGKTKNTVLPQISRELESYRATADDRLADPFLLYLAGVVARKGGDSEAAQEYLYQSVTVYPFNWSVWQELLSSLSNFSEAVALLSRFARNTKFTSSSPTFKVMLLLFEVTVYQEFFQSSTEVSNDLQYLLDVFPNLSFLRVQQALVQYNAMDYIAAEHIFDEVLAADPLRLDDMDTYSNILYVMEKKPKLAFLAQHALKIDQLRPETCCIVANYYSLKFDHQKAIMYYKRALALNRECLSAWTLMGHEFVELKNSHAAIESYRRAVDTNNKDFRAWYGLGQAYEVLDMNLYSLYYYQRACALKPMDRRMWQAIGNCCEKLSEFQDAIKAYKKALDVSADVDPAILYKLANLYAEMGDLKNTRTYMMLCLNEEANEGVTAETSKARLWLAKRELENSNWQQAYNLASDLTRGTSHDIEEARSITREARMKMTRGHE